MKEMKQFEKNLHYFVKTVPHCTGKQLKEIGARGKIGK
jgi:hypothetical protein